MAATELTSRQHTALLLLILGVIEFTFRAPILLGTTALYQRDLMLLYFPLVQSALREISNGALPLRDPTSAFGQPLLADPSCQILYPPTWLHLFLPPSLAYGWFVSIHSLFGAMGVALLARRLSRGSFPAALMGGCAWLACGPLQSLSSLWHHLAGASWIPWVWLALERVLSRSEGGAGLWLGAAMGAQMIAGSADMCAMTLLLAGLRVMAAGEWRLWKVWIPSGVLALTLSAGVWLPAAELVANSGRSSLTETVRTYWSMNPVSIFEFFLPVPISALPLLPEWRQAFFEGREPFLGSMFLGVSILPLGLAAIADASMSRSVRASGFLGTAGAVLAAIGKHGPFYSWLVSALPVLKILRFPAKAMIPAAVLMCAFAGVGVASVQRSRRSRRVAIAAAVVLGVVLLGFKGPLMGPFISTFLDRAQTEGMAQVHANLPGDLLMSAGLLALLVGYSFVKSPTWSSALLAILLLGHLRQSQSLHDSLNPTVPTGTLSYRPKHLELMRPPKGGRLYVYDYWLFEGRAKKYLGDQSFGQWDELKSLSPHSASLVATRTYMNPLVGAFWNVDYAWDSNLRLLFDPRLAELTTAVRKVEGTPGFLKLLQISGVLRVVTMHDAGMSDLQLLALKEFHPKPLRIFSVPDPLPRAFMVSGRVRGTGGDVRDLLDPGFDPRLSVLVDGEPRRPPMAGFEGDARILDERSDHITVDTRSNGPGFLGLIEGAMPGWRAWIDGRPVPVERANALFIGAEVPKGAHRVEFRFLPATAVAGVLLSGLASLFLLHAALKVSPVPGQRG